MRILAQSPGDSLKDSQNFIRLFIQLYPIRLTSFKSRDEQEVAGYAEALRLVQESYDKIDLTENNIKYLHQVLLKFSDKDARHLEEYKKHLQHLVRTEKLILHGKGR